MKETKNFTIVKEASFWPGGERWIYTIYLKGTNKTFGVFKEYQYACDRISYVEKIYSLGETEGSAKTALKYKIILFSIVLVVVTVFGIAVKQNIN